MLQNLFQGSYIEGKLYQGKSIDTFNQPRTGTGKQIQGKQNCLVGMFFDFTTHPKKAK